MLLRRSGDPIPFEQAILPHLGAAYNLARWLTRNDQDAEDVTQEACIRAFRFYTGYQGANARAWLLKIVRNVGYTWLRKNRAQDLMTPFDEAIHDRASDVNNPETLLMQSIDRAALRRAMEALPAEFREALVLRELEGLSYKEIAEVADVPIGTVMSRLSRARKLLQRHLADRDFEELRIEL